MKLVMEIARVMTTMIATYRLVDRFVRPLKDVLQNLGNWRLRVLAPVACGVQLSSTD